MVGAFVGAFVGVLVGNAVGEPVGAVVGAGVFSVQVCPPCWESHLSWHQAQQTHTMRHHPCCSHAEHYKEHNETLTKAKDSNITPCSADVILATAAMPFANRSICSFVADAPRPCVTAMGTCRHNLMLVHKAQLAMAHHCRRDVASELEW